MEQRFELIGAEFSYGRKIEILQKFLGEKYFHENGIMYSMWFWDDLPRPFLEKDFGPCKNLCPKTIKPSGEIGWMHGENSLMISGNFLAAMALRYQSTAEPDALHYCRRAFNSITLIYALAIKKGRPGYLCKPFSWEYSEETSPDQYICVMHGLWQFYKIAAAQEQEIIRDMICAMADWWKQKDYILTYLSIKWCILPHHAPSMACLNSLAARMSGVSAYRAESIRLLKLAGAWPTWVDRNRREIYHPTGFPAEKGGCRWPEHLYGSEYDVTRRSFLLYLCEMGEIWLTMINADYFLETEELPTDFLKHVIYRDFKDSQIGLRNDLLSHHEVQIDLEKNCWYPVSQKDSHNGILRSFGGDWCWMDGNSRILDCAVIAHQHAPEFCDGAISLYKSMMTRLDDERLHWFVHPNRGIIPPEKHGPLLVMSSDVAVYTLMAYWRSIANKIPV